MRGAGGGASPECITVADQHLEHVSQRGWTVLCGGRDCVIAALIRGATRVPGPAQHQKLRMPSPIKAGKPLVLLQTPEPWGHFFRSLEE